MAIDQTIKLCECGCGEPAPIATQSDKRSGAVEGQPQHFIRGHQGRRDVVDRILAKCVWEGECLVWQGARAVGDYGHIYFDGRLVKPHRKVYERFYGPIPKGFHIDHVKARGCRSRRCCNPLHLEAVTPRENALRSDCPAAQNARVTHCPNGHPYSGENLYVNPSGSRRCRQCVNAAKRRYHARKKLLRLS